MEGQVHREKQAGERGTPPEGCGTVTVFPEPTSGSAPMSTVPQAALSLVVVSALQPSPLLDVLLTLLSSLLIKLLAPPPLC